MGRAILKAGPDLAALTYIVKHLRKSDREECFATCQTETPADELVLKTHQAGAFQWVCWLDGKPVASIGAHEAWPNVWLCWAYGTDDWPKVVLTLTKHVLRVMAPSLFEIGVHRLHCFASDKHEDARRWLVSMGASEGERLDFWGRDGQTFRCYWWDKRTVERDGRLRRYLPASGIAETSDEAGRVQT